MNNKLKNDPRYQNHESRPDLAGEHPQGDRLQLLAFSFFLAAFLVDQFILGWASGIRRVVPFNLRLPFSLGIIIFGGYLSLAGIRVVFNDYTNEPRIYTSGLFAYVRHPVYLGAMLVYIGLLIFILSPLAFLAFLGVIVLYDWLARDEETRMLKVFGSIYEDYMRQTPRWLPRVFRKK